MGAIISILGLVLTIYQIILGLTFIMQVLVKLKAVDGANPGVMKFMALLQKLTDPILNPLRKFIPLIAGYDITPLIAGLLLSIIWQILVSLLVRTTA